MQQSSAEDLRIAALTKGRRKHLAVGSHIRRMSVESGDRTHEKMLGGIRAVPEMNSAKNGSDDSDVKRSTSIVHNEISQKIAREPLSQLNSRRKNRKLPTSNNALSLLRAVTIQPDKKKKKKPPLIMRFLHRVLFWGSSLIYNLMEDDEEAPLPPLPKKLQAREISQEIMNKVDLKELIELLVSKQIILGILLKTISVSLEIIGCIAVLYYYLGHDEIAELQTSGIFMGEFFGGLGCILIASILNIHQKSTQIRIRVALRQVIYSASLTAYLTSDFCRLEKCPKNILPDLISNILEELTSFYLNRVDHKVAIFEAISVLFAVGVTTGFLGLVCLVPWYFCVFGQSLIQKKVKTYQTNISGFYYKKLSLIVEMIRNLGKVRNGSWEYVIFEKVNRHHLPTLLMLKRVNIFNGILFAIKNIGLSIYSVSILGGLYYFKDFEEDSLRFESLFLCYFLLERLNLSLLNLKQMKIINDPLLILDRFVKIFHTNHCKPERGLVNKGELRLTNVTSTIPSDIMIDLLFTSIYSSAHQSILPQLSSPTKPYTKKGRVFKSDPSSSEKRRSSGATPISLSTQVLTSFSLTCVLGSKTCIFSSDEYSARHLYWSILRQADLRRGSLELGGSFEYCATLHPSTTVEEEDIMSNVVFGEEFDLIRYREVLNIFDLDNDDFENKDKLQRLTKLEKERVLLARSIYRNRHVYLFEQSEEIDRRIKRLFEGMLCDKTVVYSTRNQNAAQYADKVCVIERGKVSEEGSFQELITKSGNGRLKQLLKRKTFLPKSQKNIYDHGISPVILSKYTSRIKTNLLRQTHVNLYMIDDSEKIAFQEDMKWINRIFALSIKPVEILTEKYCHDFIDLSFDDIYSALIPKEYLKKSESNVFFIISAIFSVVLLPIIVALHFYFWKTTPLTTLLIIAGLSLSFTVFDVYSKIRIRLYLIKGINLLYSQIIDYLFCLSVGYVQSNPTIVTKVAGLVEASEMLIDKGPYILALYMNTLTFLVLYILLLNIMYLGVLVIPSLLLGLSIYYYAPAYHKVSTRFYRLRRQQEASLSKTILSIVNNSFEFVRSLESNRVLQRAFKQLDISSRAIIAAKGPTKNFLYVRLIWVKLLMVFIGLLAPFLQSLIFNTSNDLHRPWCWCCGFFTLMVCFDKFELVIDLYTDLHSIGTLAHGLHEQLESKKEVEWHHDRVESFILNENKQIVSDSPYAFVAIDLGFSNHYMTILKRVNLKLEKFGRIAIYGDTFCGKKDLISVLLGIFRKTKGKLEVFGKKASRIRPSEIRNHTMFMQSTAQLFNSSVRQNIDPVSELDDDAIIDIFEYLECLRLLLINQKALIKMPEWLELSEEKEHNFNFWVNITDQRAADPTHISNTDEKLYAAAYSSGLLKEKDIEGNYISEAAKQTPSVSKFPKSIIFQENSEEKSLNSRQEPFTKSLRQLPHRKLKRVLTKATGENKEHAKQVHLDLLDQPIYSFGANIPQNIRRMIHIARTIIKMPQALFFEEESIEYGIEGSWKSNYEKIKGFMQDRLVVGLLDTTEHVMEFEEVILMHEGCIVEEGRPSILIKDEFSLLSRRMRKENPSKYRELLEAEKRKSKRQSLKKGIATRLLGEKSLSPDLVRPKTPIETRPNKKKNFKTIIEESEISGVSGNIQEENWVNDEGEHNADKLEELVFQNKTLIDVSKNNTYFSQQI